MSKKKKLIEVKASFSMPCHPAWLRIKGQEATLSEFGYWIKGNKEECTQSDIKNWGCYQRRFETFPIRENQETLDKYNLSEDEYEEICDKLEEEFNVGTCGWCV